MKSVKLLKEMELPFRQDSEVRVGDGGGGSKSHQKYFFWEAQKGKRGAGSLHKQLLKRGKSQNNNKVQLVLLVKVLLGRRAQHFERKYGLFAGKAY